MGMSRLAIPALPAEKSTPRCVSLVHRLARTLFPGEDS
jgi:hypothetical protein